MANSIQAAIIFTILILNANLLMSSDKHLNFLEINSKTVPNQCANMTIGIVANANPPNGDDFQQVKIDENYVKWLEEQGANVIPIVPFMTDEVLFKTLKQVNGVLFQGGGRYISPKGKFEVFVDKILNYAIKMDKTNDKIAIWATCQGFELTALLLSNVTVRDNTNLFGRSVGTEKIGMKTVEYSKNVNWKLKNHLLTLKNNVFQSFTTKTVNGQFHSWYLRPSSFDYFNSIKNLIEITSVQYDKTGAQFVDTYQGKGTLNIFGSQFHPEKTTNKEMYESIYGKDYAAAIQVSKGIASFFVNEAARLSLYCFTQDKTPLATVRSNSKNYGTCNQVNYFYYYNNANGDYTDSKGAKAICSN